MLTSAPATPPASRQGAFRFPECPASWHYLGSRRDLQRGPIRLDLGPDACFVGYLTERGRVVVLDGRCSHVGSNLALATVVGEHLRCPLHGWEHNATGACVAIPNQNEIPHWARQCTFPVQEVNGHVFFFNRPEAAFPFPSFEGAAWSELHVSRPFELPIHAPWFVVGTNGFDLQHFRCSHDRELLGVPVVDMPHPLARRIAAIFRVVGDSVRDRLTRLYSGSDQILREYLDWLEQVHGNGSGDPSDSLEES